MDGKRLGWVGLGDPLDTDGFELASVDARFMGFSFRLDTRKASGAVIRLQLAEAVREEITSDKKVGGKCKKELKEAITTELSARAEFVLSVIDAAPITPASDIPNIFAAILRGEGMAMKHHYKILCPLVHLRGKHFTTQNCIDFCLIPFSLRT